MAGDPLNGERKLPIMFVAVGSDEFFGNTVPVPLHLASESGLRYPNTDAKRVLCLMRLWCNL